MKKKNNTPGAFLCGRAACISTRNHLKYQVRTWCLTDHFGVLQYLNDFRYQFWKHDICAILRVCCDRDGTPYDPLYADGKTEYRCACTGNPQVGLSGAFDGSLTTSVKPCIYTVYEPVFRMDPGTNG